VKAAINAAMTNNPGRAAGLVAPTGRLNRITRFHIEGTHHVPKEYS
jgi:hypothetical protein